VDPLGDLPENQSTSNYAYVWNNPLNAIDPDGRNGIITVDKKKKHVNVQQDVHYLKGAFEKGPNFSGSSNVMDFISGLMETINHEYGDFFNIDVDGESYSASFSVNFVEHSSEESLAEASSNGEDVIDFKASGFNNGSYKPGIVDGKGGKYNIPQAENFTRSSLFAHEYGHSFGLDHDQGQIISGPSGVSSSGGKKGRLGSIMTYAGLRYVTAKDVSDIVSPAVRKANEKRRRSVVKLKSYAGSLRFQN
jgi:hypothetical protein